MSFFFLVFPQNWKKPTGTDFFLDISLFLVSRLSRETIGKNTDVEGAEEKFCYFVLDYVLSVVGLALFERFFHFTIFCFHIFHVFVLLILHPTFKVVL